MNVPGHVHFCVGRNMFMSVRALMRAYARHSHAQRGIPINMHSYIHSCVHAYMYTMYTPIFIHVRINTHARVAACIGTCTHSYLRLYGCTLTHERHLRKHSFMYVCVCIYMHMHVYTSQQAYTKCIIHTYTHVHTHVCMSA